MNSFTTTLRNGDSPHLLTEGLAKYTLLLEAAVSLYIFGGTHGAMVIIKRNGHNNLSSSPKRDYLHFTRKGIHSTVLLPAIDKL